MIIFVPFHCRLSEAVLFSTLAKKMLKNAKIVATLGPSSNDEKTIRAMIAAGMDVARLNFSHGDHAEHLERITLIRKLSEEVQKPITILQDHHLKGCKMVVTILKIIEII